MTSQSKKHTRQGTRTSASERASRHALLNAMVGALLSCASRLACHDWTFWRDRSCAANPRARACQGVGLAPAGCNNICGLKCCVCPPHPLNSRGKGLAEVVTDLLGQLHGGVGLRGHRLRAVATSSLHCDVFWREMFFHSFCVLHTRFFFDLKKLGVGTVSDSLTLFITKCVQNASL